MKALKTDLLVLVTIKSALFDPESQVELFSAELKLALRLQAPTK